MSRAQRCLACHSPPLTHTPPLPAPPADLARNLFSRDPILFDAAINSHFSSHARYSGHALSIGGVSAIKHAAFTLNYLDLGRGADVRSKDVSWSAKDSRATIKSTRHIRPVFFPLFTLAVPVETTIQFHPERSSGPALLYATSWEDRWPLTQFLSTLPIISTLLSALITPILSFFVITLCNAFFALHSHVASHLRRNVEPSAHAYAKRAHNALPKAAADAATQGFQRGSTAATGYAEWGLRLVKGVAYGPLVLIEGVTQTVLQQVVQPFIPFQLPRVAVFDSPTTKRSFQSAAASSNNNKRDAGSAPLDEPIPLRAQKTLKGTESHAQRTEKEEETNPRGPGAKDQVSTSATTSTSASAGAAQVQVGDQAAYSIPAHQDNEALLKLQQKRPIDPTSRSVPTTTGAQDGSGKTLFDKAHEDTAALQKAEKAAEHPPAPVGGKGKKGKNGGGGGGGKRDKGGATGGDAGQQAANESHAAPPKFTDGLSQEQVKENENK